MSVREPQCAGAVLMVRPARFGHNPETAASNALQADAAALAGTSGNCLGELALREFDAVAAALQASGVAVMVADDSAAPAKPDALFPNNWVSFHRDGTVVLYPMMAPNRRLERREEIVQQVVSKGGFRTSRTVDLSHREAEGLYLEGTGSLVLDRAHGVAYAGLSPRTDLDVLGEFAQQLDFELVAFDARDAAGRAIYHTNVMMSVGATFAVVCTAAIDEPAQRSAVVEKLRSSDHEVIDISWQQMTRFAANVLQLQGASGPVLALSTTALESFSLAERRRLERHAELIAVGIPVIERVGGGGVRCMLAEIHLPKR
jgi:hypothetical protein